MIPGFTILNNFGPMRFIKHRPFLKTALPILLITINFSCSKNSTNSNTITCNLNYTDSAPLTTNQAVVYQAGVSGYGGTISSITYLDSAGTTTVKSPALPWIVTVNLKSGATVSISATGTANAGGHVNFSAFVNNELNGSTCDH